MIYRLKTAKGLEKNADKRIMKKHKQFKLPLTDPKAVRDFNKTRNSPPDKETEKKGSTMKDLRNDAEEFLRKNIKEET